MHGRYMTKPSPSHMEEAIRMAFWDGAQWSRPGAGQPASARRRPSFVDWIATLVLIGGLLMIALLASELRAATPMISGRSTKFSPKLGIKLARLSSAA